MDECIIKKNIQSSPEQRMMFNRGLRGNPITRQNRMFMLSGRY